MIKYSIIKKIIYPKVIDINIPGIIKNNVNNIFSNAGKLRLVYLFEDVLIELQAQTIKKLGFPKTQELYYKIGKDTGVASCILANLKPAKGIFRNLFIKQAIQTIYFSGVGAFETFTSTKNLSKIKVAGRNNLMCRKTGVSAFTAGLLSGILTSFIGKNREAESHSNCKNCNAKNCIFFSDEKMPLKYSANVKKSFIDSYKNNFVETYAPKEKLVSLKDLITFKKVSFLGDKDVYKNKTLFISNVTSEMIYLNYERTNQLDLLYRGLCKGAEKLAESGLFEGKTQQAKLQELRTILCAFGWGYPYFHVNGEKRIEAVFYHHPYSQCGFDVYAYEINGYLNSIFGKKFRIEKLTAKKNPVITKIVYVSE